MTETLRITYMKCGFCTAKNHCAACGGELSRALEEKPGVEAANVSMADHTLHITHTLDGGELEDLLDAMGLMAE